MNEDDIRKRDVFNNYLRFVEQDVKVFFKPAEFLKINCPACGHSNSKDEFIKSNFTYVLCRDCGTLYINPRPSIEALKEFYVKAPSSRYWVEEFFKPVVEIRREKIFKPRADFAAHLISSCENRCLIGDVGAGFGLFLEELRKISPGHGFVAIEPSLEMADICSAKGLEVIPDVAENVSSAYHSKFDLLTAFELFEHLGKVETFVHKILELLKPGGCLLLTTLNGEGFDIQTLWQNSKSITPPHHLNFFNPNSARILFTRMGFEIKEISTPGVLDWDILEGAYKKEGAEIPRFWKMISNRADSNAKTAFQNWLTSYGFSSHMRILVQKSL